MNQKALAFIMQLQHPLGWICTVNMHTAIWYMFADYGPHFLLQPKYRIQIERMKKVSEGNKVFTLVIGLPKRTCSSGRVLIHQERQIVDQIPGNKKNVHKTLHLRLRNHQGQITPVDRGDLSFGDIGLTYPVHGKPLVLFQGLLPGQTQAVQIDGIQDAKRAGTVFSGPPTKLLFGGETVEENDLR